jgi:hypothetical protein
MATVADAPQSEHFYQKNVWVYSTLGVFSNKGENKMFVASFGMHPYQIHSSFYSWVPEVVDGGTHLTQSPTFMPSDARSVTTTNASGIY